MLLPGPLAIPPPDPAPLLDPTDTIRIDEAEGNIQVGHHCLPRGQASPQEVFVQSRPSCLMIPLT